MPRVHESERKSQKLRSCPPSPAHSPLKMARKSTHQEHQDHKPVQSLCNGWNVFLIGNAHSRRLWEEAFGLIG